MYLAVAGVSSTRSLSSMVAVEIEQETNLSAHLAGRAYMDFEEETFWHECRKSVLNASTRAWTLES